MLVEHIQKEILIIKFPSAQMSTNYYFGSSFIL